MTDKVLRSGPGWEIVVPPVAKVELVAYTQNAEEAIAAATRTYTHKLEKEITPEDTTYFLNQIRKTRLQTPLEFIYYTFLIKDVTRAFTHQIVRYRVGTGFAQESLRFAVKDTVRVLASDKMENDPLHLDAYAAAVAHCADTYHEALKDGVSTDDVRGILPTNILTGLFFTASLRTLSYIYMQRACCQAAWGEWTYVVRQIKKLVRSVHPDLADFLTPPGMGTKCGFQADFDKPCRYVGKSLSDLEKIEEDELVYFISWCTAWKIGRQQGMSAADAAASATAAREVKTTPTA